MKSENIIDKRDCREVRAAMLREFPTEDLVTKYVNEMIMMGVEDPEFTRRLPMARFLVNKALVMLPDEMDVRGAQTVLEAIQKVEELKVFVEDHCDILLPTE